MPHRGAGDDEPHGNNGVRSDRSDETVGKWQPTLLHPCGDTGAEDEPDERTQPERQ
jgi:hypothetical protein